MQHLLQTACKVAVVASLVLCFLLQVRESLDKFAKGRTTIVTSTEALAKDPLPVISFCSGFTEGNETDWASRTYKVEEFISNIRMPGTETETTLVNITGAGEVEELEGGITSMRTRYGNCYSLRLRHPMVQEEFYTVRLNASGRRSVTVYFHEEGGQAGLCWNRWPSAPSAAVLGRGEQYTLIARRGTFRAASDNNCKDYEEDEPTYSTCVWEWLRREHGIEQGCWYPPEEFVPSYLEEVDYDQDTEGKYAQIADAMLDQSQTGCRHPCDSPKYETVVVQEADSPELSAEEIEFYPQVLTLVEHRSEVGLYDLGRAVADTGGSLGLFLGISCFAVGKVIGAWWGKERRDRSMGGWW